MRQRILPSRPVVMHVAPGHYAADARLFHLECAVLEKAGYQVELVARSTEGTQLNSSVNFHAVGALDRHSWRWQLFDRFRRSHRAYRIARRSKASLFHVHSPEFIRWGIRLGRNLHRKVVFDCREDYEGWALWRPGIPDFLRESLAVLIGRQLEWAARNCDALIVADQATADRFQEHATRTLLLHNFPRLDLFPYKGPQGEEKIFDVVFHGIMPRRFMELCLGIDDVLSQQGHKIRWRLIPKEASPDIDMTWLRDELLRRNARQRFFIDGQIPHDRIADEVSKGKIGIILLPNVQKYQKNIPRKLFEFMALGMPVVLGDLPPTRPFVSHERNALLVPPEDCRAYAAAISRLLDDPTLCRMMGAEGRRLVENEYNWESESQKLLNLYSELLKS